MKRTAAILVMFTLIVLGPATVLCGWSCASCSAPAAASMPLDACTGHGQHSTPHGGTKDCGGHPRARIVATAPANNISSLKVTIVAATIAASELDHSTPVDNFSLKAEFLSTKNPHPKSSPPALRI